MKDLATAVMEASPIGLALTDLSGRYVAANPAFLDLVRYTEEELRGRTLEELAHVDEGPQCRRALEDVAAAARSRVALVRRYVRKDGREVWTREILAPVPGNDGRPRYVLALVDDVPAGGGEEERMHALARRVVDAEELERHRIAGELHDRVGQQLSALNINLDVAHGLAQSADVELRVRLADSLALLEATQQSIEHLMAELRPPLIAEYGLAAALGLHAREFSQRTGVQVAVDDPEELGSRLPRETAMALFRIAQEALANVAKHAGARRVKILLETDAHGLALDISDDGCGFDPRKRLAQATRWGMTTMHERASAVGGRLSVASAPGGGTTVRVSVPVHA